MVQAAKDCASVDVMFSAHTHEYTYDPIPSPPLLSDRDGEHTPEPDADAAETVEAVRAPFFEADPGFGRGAGTLDRPLDAVVGRTEEPLYRQSFLESAWNALFNDALRAHFGTDLAVSHGFRYGTAIPPGDITRRTLHVLPDDDARRSWRRLRPATHEPHGGVPRGQLHTVPYDQEDGRVRNFSSNVEVTLDPTAKRGRRLVELQIDGEPVDPGDVLGGDVPPTR